MTFSEMSSAIQSTSSDVSNGATTNQSVSSKMSARHSMRHSMGDSMRHHRCGDDRGGDHLMDHGSGVDSLGVSGLSLVADLHHSAAISSISSVGHILDPAIRERHAVLALDVACTISCLLSLKSV